jgi:hypothetical protein
MKMNLKFKKYLAKFAFLAIFISMLLFSVNAQTANTDDPPIRFDSGIMMSGATDDEDQNDSGRTASDSEEDEESEIYELCSSILQQLSDTVLGIL